MYSCQRRIANNYAGQRNTLQIALFNNNRKDVNTKKPLRNNLNGF